MPTVLKPVVTDVRVGFILGEEQYCNTIPLCILNMFYIICSFKHLFSLSG